MPLVSRLLKCGLLVALSLESSYVIASDLGICGRCGWLMTLSSLLFGDKDVSGGFTLDKDKDVILEDPSTAHEEFGGASFRVSDFTANNDPSTSFAFSARNTSSSSVNYDFRINLQTKAIALPIATVQADYSVGSSNLDGGELSRSSPSTGPYSISAVLFLTQV